LLVFALVGIYNGLVVARNRFKNAFAQIDVQLKRRYDLIPNLIEAVKGYMAHERETLEGFLKYHASANQVPPYGANSKYDKVYACSDSTVPELFLNSTIEITENKFLANQTPHSPGAGPVLTVSGAAGAKANSSQTQVARHQRAALRLRAGRVRDGTFLPPAGLIVPRGLSHIGEPHENPVVITRAGPRLDGLHAAQGR
jgi:hypothetical protein